MAEGGGAEGEGQRERWRVNVYIVCVYTNFR